MRNSYLQFFELFPKKGLFDFGLENTIIINPEYAMTAWNELKDNILRRDSGLFVRNFGSNGANNGIVSKLYSDLFGININFDKTNNREPKLLIERLTGYKVNGDIYNYQISHVFGRTKNVYAFTAPWNVVFIPKIVDPFTGHEAKGDFVGEYQLLFTAKIKSAYSNLISEYNVIMEEKDECIRKWIETNVDNRIKPYLKDEFKAIAS